MAESGSSRSQPSLYELFVRLSRCTPDDDARLTIDEILGHSQWDAEICVACATLVKCRRPCRVGWEDLLQGTRCLLVDLLVNGKRTYQDQGGKEFRNWWRRVVLTAAERAWPDSQPIWGTDCILADEHALDSLAVIEEEVIDRSELLAAVEMIPSRRPRNIVRDWVLGLTLGESADLRELSISEVWKILRDGREQLRDILLRE